MGRHKLKVTIPSEQTLANEVISKAVAEATRVAIQAMAAAMAEKPHSVASPKIGGPAMKQSTFNWADDKYIELKTFMYMTQRSKFLSNRTKFL